MVAGNGRLTAIAVDTGNLAAEATQASSLLTVSPTNISLVQSPLASRSTTSAGTALACVLITCSRSRMPRTGAEASPDGTPSSRRTARAAMSTTRRTPIVAQRVSATAAFAIKRRSVAIWLVNAQSEPQAAAGEPGLAERPSSGHGAGRLLVSNVHDLAHMRRPCRSASHRPGGSRRETTTRPHKPHSPLQICALVGTRPPSRSNGTRLAEIGGWGSLSRGPGMSARRRLFLVLTAPIWGPVLLIGGGVLCGFFWVCDKLSDPMVGRRCTVCGSENHWIHPCPEARR